MKVVERDDTAGSAREIAEGQLRRHGRHLRSRRRRDCTASRSSSRGIETNRHNFTRFLILADESRAAEFHRSRTTPTRPRSSSPSATPRAALSKVLTVLSFYDINLTKIQSLPIIGREWEYQFYVDVTFDDPYRYRQAIDAARPLTSGFRILGEYAEGANPEI